MWATLKELLEDKEIVIEDDRETFAQVSSRKYIMASNGKIQLERKDDMKKRGLDSPDRADAAALSVYLGKIKKYTGSAPSQKVVDSLGKSSYWANR